MVIVSAAGRPTDCQEVVFKVKLQRSVADKCSSGEDDR